MNTAIREPELQDPTTEDDEDDEDDDEDGWLIVFVDGEHQIVPHPEDREREDVVKEFFEAKKKQHHAYRLGGWIFDTNTIRAFGWERECEHPEIDRFDGIQGTLEGLMGAMGELIEAQHALQAAQAALLQGDLEELEAESMEDMEAQAAANTAKARPRKGGFRPPGA